MRKPFLLAIVYGVAASSGCQRPSVPEASTPTPAAPTEVPPASTSVPVSDKREYQCGEIKVSADFHGTGPVTLRFAETELSLPNVASGSGARYADGNGNEFWSKGDDAMFTIAGQERRICTPASAPPA